MTKYVLRHNASRLCVSVDYPYSVEPEKALERACRVYGVSLHETTFYRVGKLRSATVSNGRGHTFTEYHREHGEWIKGPL